MSALYQLSIVLSLFVVMAFAYVMARFVTGYPQRHVDSWEKDELGESR